VLPGGCEMPDENKQKTEYMDITFSTRTIVMVLWIVLILLYVYCDHFSFFRTGELEKVIAGFMGPFKITQLSLILASLLTIIPSLAIIACLFLKSGILRWINIMSGIVFTLVNIANIVGETWAYYLAYGIIELCVTLLITIMSIKWPTKI
jgi:hypothetical protein